MSERINSPIQLNEKLKVSKLNIWIILVAILVIILGILFWFIDKKIILKETYQCFVTDKVMNREDALYELYEEHFGNSVEYSRETIQKDYATYLNGIAQIGYLIIPDMTKSNMSEAMVASVGGVNSHITFLPKNKTKYEEIEKLGINHKNMREVGLNPGNSYYVCEVFIEIDDESEKLDSKFYTATIELEHIDFINLILK